MTIHETVRNDEYLRSPVANINDITHVMDVTTGMVSLMEANRYNVVYNAVTGNLEPTTLTPASVVADLTTPAQILALAESGSVVQSSNGNFRLHAMRGQKLADVGLVGSQMYTLSEGFAESYEIRNWLRAVIPTTDILFSLLGMTYNTNHCGIITGQRTANTNIHFARFGSNYQSVNYSNPLSINILGFAIERVS